MFKKGKLCHQWQSILRLASYLQFNVGQYIFNVVRDILGSLSRFMGTGMVRDK